MQPFIYAALLCCHGLLVNSLGPEPGGGLSGSSFPGQPQLSNAGEDNSCTITQTKATVDGKVTWADDDASDGIAQCKQYCKPWTDPAKTVSSTCMKFDDSWSDTQGRSKSSQYPTPNSPSIQADCQQTVCPTELEFMDSVIVHAIIHSLISLWMRWLNMLFRQ